LIDDPERTAAGYDILPSVRCPVLLLQADAKAGGIMMDAEVERGLTLLSNSTHILLEGVGHWLHNEQKDVVLQAITDFLKSL